MPKIARNQENQRNDNLAADCRGLNFYTHDSAFQELSALYLDDALRAHIAPHYRRLGALAGGELDTLAAEADRHPPILQARDRWGRDEDQILYHPAYQAMAKIAFNDFGLHAMSHRGGVLDWPEPYPAVAKYGFQYLFVQGEFGLMCPVSVTDTSLHLILKYGSEDLKQRYGHAIWSQDPEAMLTGAQFMTEKAGGSDVGRIETEARHEGGVWRLYGEKWFCSHADADVALLLARPAGAPAGSRGLALFLLPRHLPDGRRNRQRILRLKDKLGTRSMASGEIMLNGAEAYVVGDLNNGLKQMLDQVNLSRLSHGVRAAAMMRRCLNEAMAVAHSRIAFQHPLIALPLFRRLLLQIMAPTEQALSLFMYTAATMDRCYGGDDADARCLRLLTALLKYRSCKDNVRVATLAMEARGGNGYIEDWVNARLVRDAQVGLLWEGTSNIIALDALQRCVGRLAAHIPLSARLKQLLANCTALPPSLRDDIGGRLDQAVEMAEKVAGDPGKETLAPKAASHLYDAVTVSLMAYEACHCKDNGGRRLLLAQEIISENLDPHHPFETNVSAAQEQRRALLLSARAIALSEAVELAIA